jgi:hypothetical protein
MARLRAQRVEQIRLERDARREILLPPISTWREWVEQQAQQGDEAAIGASAHRTAPNVLEFANAFPNYYANPRSITSGLSIASFNNSTNALTGCGKIRPAIV